MARNSLWTYVFLNLIITQEVIRAFTCKNLLAFFMRQHCFRFDLPDESVILADKAYNDYRLEDSLKEEGIHLMPIRKKNSKRKYESFTESGIKLIRKRIESAFGVIK